MTPIQLTELCLGILSSQAKPQPLEALILLLNRFIPSDAIVALLHEEGEYRPVAQFGLVDGVMGRRFNESTTPRFKAIAGSEQGIVFNADSSLADPYDGLLRVREGAIAVHSCMGVPVRVKDHLVGIITFDSLSVGQYEQLDSTAFRTLCEALSGAAPVLYSNVGIVDSYSAPAIDRLETVSANIAADHSSRLIGHAPAMLKLKEEIGLIATTDFSVLLEGETGVGKEVVAHEVHNQSARADEPMVYVNCAALPEQLAESELFGHQKGAFTGAYANRIGKFAQADGGTLFLDEIGELPLDTQSKLLRALQSKEIQPVGLDSFKRVDVRIIAATNRDLEKEVSAGRFRADLYHRLAVFPIHIAPLRARRSDVAILANYFVERIRERLHIRNLVIGDDALQRLEHYDWPGNVRELEHVLARAALFARRDAAGSVVRIQSEHLTQRVLGMSAELIPIAPSVVVSEANKTPFEEGSLKTKMAAAQSQAIEGALQHCHYNWSKAARLLDVDRSNLVRMAKRLNIKMAE